MSQIYDTVFAAIPTREGHVRCICHPSRRMTLLYFQLVHPSDMQVCQAVKDVSTSYDALVDFLESIEHFMNRLDMYTSVHSTGAMTEMDQMMVKIMVEMISTLALVTKQIKQKRPSEFVTIYMLLT